MVPKLRSVSTILPLCGISPLEPLIFGTFTVVSGDDLKKYSESNLGYSVELIGFDHLAHWSADAFVIHTVDTNERDLNRVANASEEEILFFVSVLSCCFWVSYDLRRTMQLQHEAYHLQGSRRFTFASRSRAHNDLHRHVGRGYSTLVCRPPLQVDLKAFQRLIGHPLFKPLFEVLGLDTRSDFHCRLLKSVRSIYFALSSNTNEGQLIGAITSIDALLAPSPEELRKVSRIISQGDVLVKHQIRTLLGETELGNVIRFSDPLRSEVMRPLFAYDQRHKVVHDGDLCDDGTVVDAFRLALRVLFSTAQVVHFYESRIDFVIELDSRFEKYRNTGGGVHPRHHVCFGYPWLENGMPDFLPFVICRYARLYSETDRELLKRNLCMALHVIMQQRGVARVVAYRSVQQSTFTNLDLPTYAEVEYCSDHEHAKLSAMEHAVFCRAGSPLAWVINDDDTWKRAESTIWEA